MRFPFLFFLDCARNCARSWRSCSCHEPFQTLERPDQSAGAADCISLGRSQSSSCQQPQQGLSVQWQHLGVGVQLGHRAEGISPAAGSLLCVCVFFVFCFFPCDAHYLLVFMECVFVCMCACVCVCNVCKIITTTLSSELPLCLPLTSTTWYKSPFFN